MTSKYSRHSAPMTQDEYRAHQKRQAEERGRRGFTTFTRSEVREAVMGSTRGENTLQTGHRATQVTYPKRKRGR